MLRSVQSTIGNVWKSIRIVSTHGMRPNYYLNSKIKTAWRFELISFWVSLHHDCPGCHYTTQWCYADCNGNRWIIFQSELSTHVIIWYIFDCTILHQMTSKSNADMNIRKKSDNRCIMQCRCSLIFDFIGIKKKINSSQIHHHHLQNI